MTRLYMKQGFCGETTFQHKSSPPYSEKRRKERYSFLYLFMMITAETPNCYPNGQQIMPIYQPVSEDQPISSSSIQLQPDNNSSSSSSTTHTTNFLYNLSLLKDKTNQVQSLAAILFSPDHHHGPPPPESTAIAFPTMGTLIQEIIVTASSMMFACQQMSLGTSPSTSTITAARPAAEEAPSAFFSNHHDQIDHWYAPDNYNNCTSTNSHNNNYPSDLPPKKEIAEILAAADQGTIISPKHYDIVELDAADLLAKYTHYCQICGKGFKRDANLRMHMRAHGEEYKSTAALSNPAKNTTNNNGDDTVTLRKYSCPQQGCRWNKNHAKFQPLKSMICVKNHYKRSHCPKMYVCKRCNRKQFSVLSDLRTHEKHCGDLKWQCSCGTTFSRKDKLMGHVALFVGHVPLINSTARIIPAG